MQRPTYHRAYRFIARPASDVGYTVAAGVLPDVALLACARWLLRFHGRWAAALLQWLDVPVVTRTTHIGRLLAIVPEVPVGATLTSSSLVAIAIVATVIAIALLCPPSRLNPARGIVGVTSAICAISAAYAFVHGGAFPYTTGAFATAWTGAEFAIWLIIPLLFAIVLGPLPLSVRRTILYSVMAVAYAVWFSVIRLVLLLALFHAAGLIWMAPGYFVAGCLVDFVYIVGFYSVAVACTTRQLRVRAEVWQW